MAYSILIIKTGALGDVLRTTTLLPELRQKFRDAGISWLTANRAKELLLNNTLIDRIYTIEDKDNIPKNFDLVLSLDDEKDSASFASGIDTKRLVGAHVKDSKITYTEDSEPWFGMGLLRPAEKGGLEEANRLKRSNRKNLHQILAEIAGVDYNDEEPILNLTQQEIDFGRRFAEKNNISGLIIGFNTGAGKRWQLKRWSAENTAALADELIEKLDAKIILLGGKEEKERNENIKKLAGNQLIDAGTDNSLREFASIINLCDIIVTSDTLAMYIAIALKKKVIVLIGPTSSAEIEIYTRGRKLSADMPCICCYKKQCSVKPNCMDNITVDEVFKTVKELI